MGEPTKAAGNLARHPDRRRSRIGWLVASLTKFGLDSAVDGTPKASPGLRKVHEIVQDRLRDHPRNSLPLKGQTGLEVVAAKLREKQMKMEVAQKSEEGMLRLSGEASSTISVESGVVKKAPDDKYPLKDSAAADTGKKTIFIRSRL